MSTQKLLPLLVPLALAASARAQTTSYALAGGAAGQGFGARLASAGDADGDGYDDLLVGMPDASPAGTDSGRVSLYSGRTRALIRTWSGIAPNQRLGASVAVVGDVDGDGRPEVLAGSPGAIQNGVVLGQAQLYSGATGAVLRTFWGATAGGGFGSAVSPAGDIDLDGVPDLAVGEPGMDVHDEFLGVDHLDVGVVRFYLGDSGALYEQQFGTAAGDRFGSAICEAPYPSAAGVLVGAPGYGSDDRGAAIRFEVLDPWGTLVVWQGLAPGGAFGSSVCRVGYANADGAADFLVGAPEDATNGADAGRAFLLSGWNGTILLAPTGEAGWNLGASVAAPGDVDGDGLDDLFVGAPDATATLLGLELGKALVYSATGAVLHELSGPSAYSDFGAAVACGDWNGDGVVDLAAGAPNDDPNGQSSGSARLVLMGGAAGTPYCFGDGGATACPCAAGAPGSHAGCPNSVGSAGKLEATGVARVSADTLRLRGSGMPDAPCLYFQGTAQVAGGAGGVFGDGLRCVGGDVVRLGTRTNLFGGSVFPFDGEAGLAQQGGAAAGETLHYQVWYRDASPFHCTSSTTNYTNAYTVVWQP